MSTLSLSTASRSAIFYGNDQPEPSNDGNRSPGKPAVRLFAVAADSDDDSSPEPVRTEPTDDPPPAGSDDGTRGPVTV